MAHYLAANVLLNKQVLPLVVENDVDLLCPRATDVWSKHDVVLRVAMHVALVQGAWKDLGGGEGREEGRREDGERREEREGRGREGRVRKRGWEGANNKGMLTGVV